MKKSSLSLQTLNCNGLKDKIKRMHFFQSLLNENSDITLLQETHALATDAQEWGREWKNLGGGESFFNDTDSSFSKGTSIFFSKSFTPNIVSHKTENGRIQNLVINTQNQNIQIINVYGPNSRKEHFFRNLRNHAEPGIETIVCGDFNMVENTSLDRTGLNRNSSGNRDGQKHFLKFKNSLNLTDAWRSQFPDSKEYTYFESFSQTAMRHDQHVKSRLDRIYIPSHFYQKNKTKTQHVHFPNTDHKMVKINFNFPESHPSGPGLWNLPPEVLTDPDYVEQIQIFWRDWKNEKYLFSSVGEWWDIGKKCVLSISQEFVKNKNKHFHADLNKLRQNLRSEEKKEILDGSKISFLKKEIEQKEFQKNNHIFLATHQQKIELDEKPTKYFFNTLKQNRQKNEITTLKYVENHENAPNSIITSDPKIILRETTKFYAELYEKGTTVKEDRVWLLQKLHKKISEVSKQNLEKQLSIEELFQALCQMQKGKTPGIDGLSMEFYLKFWDQIGSDLHEVALENFNLGSMTKSQRKAVLKLLYKKGEKNELTNYRPISLLCVDYKIITKAFANRLKLILSEVISSDQTCGLPGRSIFSNLRLFRDIIKYAQSKNLKGFFVSLDQEKAFDRVNHDFLIDILKN